MTTESKIISRIRKLMALAQSSNVHEAEAAASAAQRLMTEHQIEEAMLVGAGEAEPDPMVHEMLVSITGHTNGWKRVVANGLARANGCKVYLEVRGTVTNIKIIGPTKATQTVRYMHMYLCQEIMRLADWDKQSVGIGGKTAFKLGAATSIAERLMSASKLVLVSAPGTALAIMDRSKEIEALTPKLRRGKGPSVSDMAAFEAGKVAGGSVRLGTGPSLESGARKGALT